MWDFNESERVLRISLKQLDVINELQPQFNFHKYWVRLFLFENGHRYFSFLINIGWPLHRKFFAELHLPNFAGAVVVFITSIVKAKTALTVWFLVGESVSILKAFENCWKERILVKLAQQSWLLQVLPSTNTSNAAVLHRNKIQKNLSLIELLRYHPYFYLIKRSKIGAYSVQFYMDL